MSASMGAALAQNRAPKLVVELARSAEDVRESQLLRYRVFAEEMGAELASAEEGLDRDHFDEFCHHLLVRCTETGAVVGSTRILTQASARLAGSFYSESEFDLKGLLPLPGNAIEIGRTCIHPSYRNGITIQTLWMGLAGFMEHHQVDYMFGCASIGLDEGEAAVKQILDRISAKHLAPAKYSVTPHHRFNPGVLADQTADRVKLPPLLSAYLRLGAWVVGEPCFDEDFNCVDAFILLDVTNLSSRYRRHFIDARQPKPRSTDVAGGVGLGLVASPNRG